MPAVIDKELLEDVAFMDLLRDAALALFPGLPRCEVLRMPKVPDKFYLWISTLHVRDPFSLAISIEFSMDEFAGLRDNKAAVDHIESKILDCVLNAFKGLLERVT